LDSLGAGRARLVVLQAEPLDGPPRALGDLAPGFRALAREAIDAGAEMVIVVPTLPDALAAELVAATWSRMATRRLRPSMSDLYSLAAKAKKLANDGPPASGDQAVLDVLVFLRVPENREDS
jgi:hypothetical protein